MRRVMHTVVALVAVFLLARPFDCFSSGKFDRKAADCCKRGKCTPSNSDGCCKATVPDGNQLATSKTTDHSTPVPEIVAVGLPATTLQPLVTALQVETHQPPGSPPDLRLNLPLLI